MKNYWLEKMRSEYSDLVLLWKEVSENWKQSGEDLEKIYQIRVPLSVLAFICRKMMEPSYIAWNENKKCKNRYRGIRVMLLKEGDNRASFDKELDGMQYPDDFEGMIKSEADLYEVCNYLIHESESAYVDDMYLYTDKGNCEVKKRDEVSIYYKLRTQHLRRRASAPEKISYFVEYSDEKTGFVLIDIKSIIEAFEKFINIKSTNE